MADLSPAAQAVRRAAAAAYWAEEYEVASPDVIAAAALRAAVEEVLPTAEPAGLSASRDECLASLIRAEIRRELLGIVTELEGRGDG